MSQVSRPTYEFGEFRLDAGERLLRRKDETLPLTPKVFDTLLLLVEDHGRVIKKDEFMQRLWPGIFVSEDTLAHNISVLRKLLACGSDGAVFIATVPKVGYRFVAPVRELAGPALVHRYNLAESSPTSRVPALRETATSETPLKP